MLVTQKEQKYPSSSKGKLGRVLSKINYYIDFKKLFALHWISPQSCFCPETNSNANPAPKKIINLKAVNKYFLFILIFIDNYRQ